MWLINGRISRFRVYQIDLIGPISMHRHFSFPGLRFNVPQYDVIIGSIHCNTETDRCVRQAVMRYKYYAMCLNSRCRAEIHRSLFNSLGRHEQQSNSWYSEHTLEGSHFWQWLGTLIIPTRPLVRHGLRLFERYIVLWALRKATTFPCSLSPVEHSLGSLVLDLCTLTLMEFSWRYEVCTLSTNITNSYHRMHFQESNSGFVMAITASASLFTSSQPSLPYSLSCSSLYPSFDTRLCCFTA